MPSCLQIASTNNEDEYEALIQGLELEQCMRFQCLCVMGYSKIIVNHIKNKYGINNCRLKAYAKKVWDLIDMNIPI